MKFCFLEEDFMIGQPEGLVYVSVFSCFFSEHLE